MGKLMVESFLLGFLIQVIAVYSADVKQLNIWPMPKSVVYGYNSLYLSKDFELKTEGTKYPDASGILKDGFSRLLAVVKTAHVIDSNFSHFDPSAILHGIHVVVISPSDELQYGIDESYNLSIPAHGKPAYAHIEARTVYGALHGLQTFSQVCHFNFSTRAIEVRQVPWTISDQPRFSYRGLLIDTSRHYQPLPMIKKVIDSMAYAKLNVLHWHIVDEQSFPLEIPSYPKLWDGAYSFAERYTMADAAEIVSYAQRRGINVLSELDVPGHALSCSKHSVMLDIDVNPSLKGVGYPSLWPSQTCKEPLDVSNEFTFKLIDGILSGCWGKTPRVRNWLNQHGMNESEAYQYFVLRAQKIAVSHGYEVVNWEETFNSFGSKLSPKTVVHNWLGGGVAERVVAAGLRCIVSNQGMWYLDHLDTPWQEVYKYEPLTNITNPTEQKLVIGGEVCMWGEHIDGSDIEQTIWPRAAAAAERLWTPYDQLPEDLTQVTPRLAHFRCLLNQRGVAAAPLDGPGRIAPEEPGSCYMQ